MVLLPVKPVTLLKIKLSIKIFIPCLSCVASFQNVKFIKVLNNPNPVPTNRKTLCCYLWIQIEIVYE